MHDSDKFDKVEKAEKRKKNRSTEKLYLIQRFPSKDNRIAVETIWSYKV